MVFWCRNNKNAKVVVCAMLLSELLQKCHRACLVYFSNALLRQSYFVVMIQL